MCSSVVQLYFQEGLQLTKMQYWKFFFRTADFEITSQIVSPPSTTNSPADTDTVILPVLRTRQSRRLKRKSLELYNYDKSASTRRGSSTGEKKNKTHAKRQTVTEEDKPRSTTPHVVVEGNRFTVVCVY